MSTSKCPKCQSSMEPGFIEDFYQPQDPHQSQWASKAHRERKVLGLVLTNTPEERYLVTTCRCTKCGFLESYALPKEG